ncbi:MAG: UvrD-helicase domain-containing protein, partial [Muribaculaceae bacterium]|nr:UvrD-helicase domain-containing protein [Muribaculaceae bacterium]
MGRNLLVIKASAGSGKTYTLAKEYIKHLLFTTGEGNSSSSLVPRRRPGDTRPLNAHRLLLAITFTNKATDEMKKRIVNELHRLSQPSVKSDYLEGFMHDTGLDEATVRQLARLAMSELLFDYSNFNVSTIDSFFQGILRNFARELDRDFNYDIQIDEKYAVRTATHNFLLSLGRAPVTTAVDKWVKEYQRQLINENAKSKKWKFFKDDGGELSEFASNINSEELRGKMEEIRSYLGESGKNGEFKSDFSRIQRFMKWAVGMVNSCLDFIAQSDAELIRYLEPMASSLKGALGNFYNKGTFTDTLKDADETKIASQFRKNMEPGPDVITHITRMVARHFDGQRVQAFMDAIVNNLGLLGMLGMIDVELERFRHETNSILIGDTNELIGTVLESGSAFVYERVGTSIAHFMIDEFQDTSSKQYENFKGLLQESLASGNFNMLIGDAKQSIYRFRNADPTVFREKVELDFKNDITDGLEDASRPAPGAPTSTNYRSSRHIIEFNNMLFEYVSQRYADQPTIADTYKDYLQALPGNIGNKPPGYVRLYTGNYGQLSSDPFIHRLLEEQGDLQGRESDKIDTLTLLPAYLMQLHERYKWGQIGILVYTNNDGQRVVQRILEYNQRTKGEQIKVISGEALQLNNSPIIRRIIATLRFIDACQFAAGEDADVDDTDENVKKMRDSIKRKLMNDQRLYAGLSRFIHALAPYPDASPAQAGQLLAQSMDSISEAMGSDDDETAGDQEMERTLAALLPGSGELTTLTSIIEAIVTQFKREETRGVSDVDREAAFVLAFQDTVAQFCSQRNGGSVREFLRYWDEKKDTLAMSSDENGDSINVMTVHKAKGLEFDCVVMPFANWQIDGNAREDKYWVTRETFVETMDSLSGDNATPAHDDVPPLLRIDAAATAELIKRGIIAGQMQEFVNKRVTDATIDNLNKTYVAMTRPCIEMHIFAGTDRDRNNHNDLKPLLTQFATSTGEMRPVTQADGNNVEGWFEYG